MIVFICFFVLSSHSSIASMPLNVQESNVRGTQFTVSWKTSSNVKAKIKYGKLKTNYQQWQTAFDDRGEEVNSDIHHITVHNLSPNTTYYYEILSGNVIDNNKKDYYRLATGPELININRFCQPAGKILIDRINNQISFQTIVYIRILGKTENSALESMISSNQYWYRDLANFRTMNHSDLFFYECGKSMIKVDIEGGKNGAASMETLAVHYESSDDERPSLFLNPCPIHIELENIIRMLKVLCGFSVDQYQHKIQMSDIIKRIK